MGLFDWITGTKKPANGVPLVSAAELKAALLAINRSTAPFVVHEGASGSADLVAEWRIVDASWYEIFARAKLTKVAKVLMRIDDAAKEVRSVDQMWSVEWRVGVPSMNLSAEAFRGQQTSIEFGTGYAFTEQLLPGQVYRYRFSTKELKSPLQQVVTENGWIWRGVAFGKL
jgi:hypothetical protein